MSTITPQDVDSYRENGYFLYNRQLFSPEKMARLNQIFEEHLAEKGSLLSDELDTPHFRDPRLLEFLLGDVSTGCFVSINNSRRQKKADMSTITPQDVDSYRENGYFLYHGQLFSPEKMARLNQIFEEHLAEKAVSSLTSWIRRISGTRGCWSFSSATKPSIWWSRSSDPTLPSGPATSSPRIRSPAAPRPGTRTRPFGKVDSPRTTTS